MKLKKLLEHTLGELPSDKLMKMKWNPITDKEPITEELGEKLEMPSVHSEFNGLINDLNKLGGAKLKAVRKIKKDGDKEVVGKGTISPKAVGFFGQAFKKIDYEATALYGENGKGSNLYQALVLVIQFSYEHERGSNGYTLRYKWDNVNPRWKRVD